METIMIGNLTLPMTGTPPALKQYLLKNNDYLIVSFHKGKYLFLSDSLRYDKITDRSVSEYLRLCQTEDVKNTFLSKKEIVSIACYLNRKENQQRPLQPANRYHVLTLNLTNECNLKCKTCSTGTTKVHRTMTFEIAKKAIDAMVSQGEDEKAFTVCFAGGEPLMKKSLVEQITAYTIEEIAIKMKQKVTFQLHTNGTLIDGETIRFLRKYGFKVIVHLDGAKACHDANRVYASGKGSFEKVIESIHLLRKNSVKTEIKATFPLNTPDLVSNFNFLEILKAPYSYSFNVSPEHPMNDGQLQALDSALKNVMDFFYVKIRHGEPIYYAGLNRKLSSLNQRMKKNGSNESDEKSHRIDAQGEGYKRLERLDECQTCSIRNICSGDDEVRGCNLDFNTERRMCRLFQIEWKNLLYLYALLKEEKGVQ